MTEPVQAITEARAQQLQEWVDEVRPLLGLPQWRITVLTEACDSEHNAYITWMLGKDRAEMRLARGFDERPEPDQRHTLTHELMHLHVSRWDRLMDQVLDEYTAGSTKAVLSEMLEDANERAVDTLAAVMVKWLPEVPPPADGVLRLVHNAA